MNIYIQIQTTTDDKMCPKKKRQQSTNTTNDNARKRKDHVSTAKSARSKHTTVCHRTWKISFKTSTFPKDENVISATLIPADFFLFLAPELVILFVRIVAFFAALCGFFLSLVVATGAALTAIFLAVWLARLAHIACVTASPVEIHTHCTMPVSFLGNGGPTSLARALTSGLLRIQLLLPPASSTSSRWRTWCIRPRCSASVAFVTPREIHVSAAIFRARPVAV